MQTKHKLTLLIFLFFTYQGMGQSCFSFGHTFTSQQEIDNFPTDYPECVQINGNVKIEEAVPNDITNLDGLLQLTSIQGALWIEDNDALTGLYGLNHLNSIGGNLYIQNNASLTSLQGLHNINPSSIYGLGQEAVKIINNTMLEECQVESVCYTLVRPGISALIYGNAAGCSSIVEAISACNLSPTDGIAFTSQQQIDDFSTDFPSITQINGNVWITEDTINNITNLDGLSQLTYFKGDFLIENNNLLTSLAGLDNLTTVKKSLLIKNNSVLTSLSGLGLLSTVGKYFLIESNDNLAVIGMESLTSLAGYLWIKDNDALVDLTGLENLSTIGGSLSITGNAVLSNIEGIQFINPATIHSSVNGLEDIQIYNNPQLASCEVQSVCVVLATAGSTNEVHNNAIGCNNTTEIDNVCVVGVNEVLPKTVVNIYPHPASSHFVISIDNEKTIDEVLIFNRLGQAILQSKETTINVSHLPSGLYIVQATTVNGKKIAQKLVIER